jgi:PKD repeat protein
MKEMKRDKTVRVLGIVMLVLLALVSVAGATTTGVDYTKSSSVTGEVPLTVTFYSTRTPIYEEVYTWIFGDGITTGEREPTHTYSIAGTYTASVTTRLYGNNLYSNTITVNVLKLTPIITWSNPAEILYGTVLSDSQLNAVASVPGTFVYTPSSGTVLNAGVQTLKVEFTPTDIAKYSTVSKDVTINVLKATPSVTWNNPADIKPKTALSDIQLDAVASVPGTFVYTPSSGTVLSKGTQMLKVDFTPTDAVNYNSVSQTSTINVLSNNGNGNGKNK